MVGNLLQFLKNIFNIFPKKFLILLIIIFLLFLYNFINIVTTDDIFVPESRDELETLIQDDNIPLGSIDIRNITDLSEIFADSNRHDFKGISKWDTLDVINMRGIFYEAAAFNQDISSWNIEKVEDVHDMFYGSPLKISCLYGMWKNKLLDMLVNYKRIY